MTPDQVEYEILKRYVERHKAAAIADPNDTDKCAREIDIRHVLKEIGAYPESETQYQAKFWFDRLAESHGNEGLLKKCSNQRVSGDAHSYNLRAFTGPRTAPAWDRMRELEQLLPSQPARQREQKFGILFSPAQAELDFRNWTGEASEDREYQISCLFLDIDGFKALNEKLTHTVVDKEVLSPFQKILERLSLHRGASYRHGGEEFLVLLPNHTPSEAAAFADKLRQIMEATVFGPSGSEVRLTVSVGVATWPIDGKTFTEILERANQLEGDAKKSGKNVVKTSSGQ